MSSLEVLQGFLKHLKYQEIVQNHDAQISVCVSKVLESNHPKRFGPHESDFGRESCRAIKWPVRFYGSDQAASAHEASFHRLEPMATNGHNLCL